jgi:hypothetical protein
MAEKISNGPNARPRDASIAQTGEGLPNDSSRPVEVSEEEERRIRQKLGAPPEPANEL